MSIDDHSGFPDLAAPARSALSAAGYTQLEHLAQVSEADLNKLHGVGPTAIATLREALRVRGLSFRESGSTSGPQAPAAASAERIDEYLQAVQEPKRRALQELRRMILEVIPEAEQVISYGLPAFRIQGTTVAGFAAFENHLSYLPFSGSVLPQLASELGGYTMTKSSLHFPIDRPLPKALVQRLIAVRIAEVHDPEVRLAVGLRRDGWEAG